MGIDNLLNIRIIVYMSKQSEIDLTNKIEERAQEIVDYIVDFEWAKETAIAKFNDSTTFGPVSKQRVYARVDELLAVVNA